MLRLTGLLAVALIAVPAFAQGSFPETNDSLFAPLDLPTPNQYRSADGRPGPSYWQQRNDYDIAVALDPATHTVSGTVRLTYTNNSPHDLEYVWMHLEQNLFAMDSRGALRTPPDSRWRGSFPAGGYQLGDVTVNGDPVTPVVTDTRMRLDLPELLESGGDRIEVEVGYSFVIPEYGADRMGRLATERGVVYELAQWYPRIAVYDDVNGWNTMPYLGQGEFYLGYGDFELAITVPSSMTVVSTGELLNPDEVYTDQQLERLEAARQSDDRVYIIRPEEVGTPASKPSRLIRAEDLEGLASGSPQSTTTWHYRAENVRDVAWAASEAFILDAANAAVVLEDGSTNNVLSMAAYPHEGIGTPDNPGWEEATRFTRASILANSHWYPYPYPVAISVAGVVGGMEYPMLHFSGVNARFMSLFGVIDHELGHNWFPMIVGSDERRYAWMDEGFNSYLNTFANREFYDRNPDPTIAGYGQSDSARVIRLTEGPAAADFMRQPWSADQPITTYPDRIRRPALGWLAYRKPAKGLMMLREQIVGPERMDAAITGYIERWAYKHPQPADFFRTVEDVTGEDLDWFWRGWFYGTGRFDQALAALEVADGTATATVENRGEVILPTQVEFRFSDGTTEVASIPAEAYFSTDTVAARVALEGRTLVSARLDPSGDLPDDDLSNNMRDM
ncbi:MAG: M1 family metallopeptidase [Rubrivirga sp.]